MGHSATHEPAEPEEEGIRYEVSVQLVQLPAVRSHERHDVSHAAHASEPSSWYSPVGHADTQLPAEKEIPGKHDKHDAAVAARLLADPRWRQPPEHVLAGQAVRGAASTEQREHLLPPPPPEYGVAPARVVAASASASDARAPPAASHTAAAPTR